LPFCCLEHINVIEAAGRVNVAVSTGDHGAPSNSKQSASHIVVGRCRESVDLLDLSLRIGRILVSLRVSCLQADRQAARPTTETGLEVTAFGTFDDNQKAETMADIVRTGWFGRDISVLMTNGKTASGELTETAENYIVITRKDGVEMQIMAHAIIAIRLSGAEEQS